MADVSDHPPFDVEVVTPDGPVFQGEARMLIVPGAAGEIGVLATGKRTASVVATSQMQLAAMFSREYKQLEARMPTLAKALRETMAKRVAETSF